MITFDQLQFLTKKSKTNETVVLREYYQLLWLKHLYSFEASKKVFFKGGTAIHLIYQAPRFSEDLDFTVELDDKSFTDLLEKTLKAMRIEAEVTFKERKTITGKRFLITAEPSILSYKIFINLDFSFREKIFE